MGVQRTREGFTIIELLIVVIVIGILAAAGLTKYQNFAEASRRKTCLGQLQAIETGLALWESNNLAFAESCKTQFAFTPRTGSLTDTLAGFGRWVPGRRPAPNTDLNGVPPNGPTSPPPGFSNSATSSPLTAVVRDDKVWACPSAVSRYYGGEIQNVADDFMDTVGGGVAVGVPHASVSAIAFFGMYGCFVCNPGSTVLANPFNNTGFYANWINNGSTVATAGPGLASPVPQVPFKVVVCGCFGTFGDNGGSPTVPGTSVINGGGPVGLDGSAASRRSTHW